MADLTYSVPSHSKAQTDTTRLKTPTMMPMVGINYLVWSVAPRYSKTFLLCSIFQGLQGYLPATGQGHSFLWHVQGLDSPSLLN